MEVSGNLWESVFLSEQYSKWADYRSKQGSRDGENGHVTL